MYKRGLKLWSVNTDFYYDEAIRLYNSGFYDYIELYVVPETLDTLQKWKELNQSHLLIEKDSECDGLNQAPSPLEGEGWGEVSKNATHLYSKQALDYSKELRKNLTDAEKILWYYLRNKQLNGLKFRRQQAIGEYIVDFVCFKNKLVIELDGGEHLEKKQILHDKKRDEFLIKNGFNVLRIFNNEIFNNIEGVIDKILNNLTPHPNPLPQGAREINLTPNHNPLTQVAREIPLYSKSIFKNIVEQGIPFIIHNAHFAQGFNLAKKEKENRNREIYEQTKQFADELNAKYIIFHGGIDGTIEETATQLASFDEPRALIENKPFIALPNRMGGEFCRGYNVDEIKLVMDTANCGLCLDFGHAICAANSLFDKTPYPQGAREQFVYDYCKDFLQLNPKMYHLTDLDDIKSPFDSHLHLGTGQLNFDKIMPMISENKPITFETNKNSKTDLNDFIEDMNFLNRYYKS